MTSDLEDWKRTKKWLFSKGIWGPGDENKKKADFLEEFDEEDQEIIERLSLGK